MLIAKITDSDFGNENKRLENPRTRIGARGIVFKGNNIAVFNKAKKNEYKLPGGGVEDDEDFELAFKREVLEETGCEIKIISKLGEIEENQSLENFKQISHVFVAKVVKDFGKLQLTEKEQNEGARLLWVDVDEALILIENALNNLTASAYDSVYRSKFMVKRDVEILKYYKKQN